MTMSLSPTNRRPFPHVSNEQIGQWLQNTSDETIALIARKASTLFSSTLSRNIALNEVMPLQGTRCNLRTKSCLALSLKPVHSFVEKAEEIFKNEMKNEFRLGNKSLFFAAGLTYSYTLLLECVMGEEGDSFSRLNCNDFSEGYRIQLGLDLEGTRRDSKLTFLIKERSNGRDVYSVTFIPE